MRVFIPATVRTLRSLVDTGELDVLGGTAFALTPALRESYHSGDAEELEYAALLEAARASVRLIAAELADPGDGSQDGVPVPRRVVVAADVADVTLRPDLDFAVVRVAHTLPRTVVRAVHVDDPDAAEAVTAAAKVIDAADLGDGDAEFALGEAEDHELGWYGLQELPFLLELM